VSQVRAADLGTPVTPPARHWWSYGTDPLPTAQEANTPANQAFGDAVHLDLDEAADRRAGLTGLYAQCQDWLPAESLRTHMQNRQNRLPPETRGRRYSMTMTGSDRQPHADCNCV
jgi:hypothetical protein